MEENQEKIICEVFLQPTEPSPEQISETTEKIIPPFKKRKRLIITGIIIVAAIISTVFAIALTVAFQIGTTVENGSLYDEGGLLSAKSGGKWGFIDKTGTFVINPQFDSVSDFQDDIAIVSTSDKYGFIDLTGQYIINPQFDYASNFSEGLARVLLGEKYGYINKDGNYVINPQFDYAGNFIDGLALVEVEEKCGYINKDGSYAINPQFDDAEVFCNDVAAVKNGDLWGFINKNGDVVINYQFPEVYSMHDDGYAIAVTTTKEYVVIDKAGKIIGNANFDGLNGIATTFCQKSGCYKASYGDEYCSTHDSSSSSTYYPFCAYYSCLNRAYVGDYCTKHDYLE